MKILFVGDVHARFVEFERIVNESDADFVIQCGDFGIWTDAVPGKQLPKAYWRKYNKLVYFVEGNHDNHAWLAWAKDNMPRTVSGEGVIVADSLIWMPRGTKCEFGGKKFFFCGGADSVDKAYRLRWYTDTWWPGEVIEESVLDAVQEDEAFDIVVTHDRPGIVTHYIGESTWPGQSTQTLDKLAAKIKARDWFHGHWHIRQDAVLNGTHYHGLDMLGGFTNCETELMEFQST